MDATEQDPTETFLHHLSVANSALSTSVADALTLHRLVDAAREKHAIASEAVRLATEAGSTMAVEHQSLAEEALRPVAEKLAEFKNSLPAGIV